MLFTVLILLALALILSVLLWAGTLWFQGWLYSEPAGNLSWSAPAVGVGITLFLAIWVIVDCWTGGRVQPLQKTSVAETRRFDEIKAVVTKKGPEETFRRVPNADNRLDYRQADGTTLPRSPEKIIVDEAGAKIAFEPERDAKGNFTRQQGQNLRYLDKYGRVMVEGELGEVTQYRFDLLFLNVLFNLLHFGLWFAGLWLLLRYQWSHALGLAAGLWLAMTLFPIPMLLGFAESAFHIVTIH